MGKVEVRNGIIGNLNIHKKTGPDGMRPRVLKEMRVEVGGAVVEIFYSSLNTAA